MLLTITCGVGNGNTVIVNDDCCATQPESLAKSYVITWSPAVLLLGTKSVVVFALLVITVPPHVPVPFSLGVAVIVCAASTEIQWSGSPTATVVVGIGFTTNLRVLSPVQLFSSTTLTFTTYVPAGAVPRNVLLLEVTCK